MGSRKDGSAVKGWARTQSPGGYRRKKPRRVVTKIVGKYTQRTQVRPDHRWKGKTNTWPIIRATRGKKKGGTRPAVGGITKTGVTGGVWPVDTRKVTLTGNSGDRKY